jgi:hypothetical protein
MLTKEDTDNLIELCDSLHQGDWNAFLQALRESLKHPHHWKQRRRIEADILSIEQILKDENVVARNKTKPIRAD